MSPGFTFERVYHALKERLKSGHYRPGDHLEPAALGPELNASITPVRDALHRLVGERIVEAPRNDGFVVPAPTEAELRDLYGWNRSLLELALRASPLPSRTSSRVEEPESIESDAELFRMIADRTGSAEHEAAVQSLNDRLASLRVVERQIFEDIAEERGALLAAWAEGEFVQLRRLLTAYHRRRQRCVPQILVASRGARRDR